MNLKVTQKYISSASKDAPGEHYTLTCTEPERRVSPGAYRHYAFYRSPRGSEVASDIGYGTGPYHPLAPDGDLFRIVKAAVEEYDARAAGGVPGDLEGYASSRR